METNSIKSLIIDDDPFIRDLLQDKLSQYCPEVEVMSTASSGTEGLQKIASYKPALIFLDVEMVDMTGFEMLSKLDGINFQTIFITSYSHYAIKAIRFNALDYLVKPIDLGELKEAIKRYKESIEKTPQRENLTLELHNWNTKEVSGHKLTLQTQDGALRLIIKDIIRIEGERNYSFIYLKDGKNKLVTKTLTDLEELLNDKGFFRCHKSHLINFIHIKSYQKSFSVLLNEDTEIPIARRRKEDFKLWYDSYEG
ncbi:MAG: two-component system LytT family response regulator [Patescibacteria group bacterium]|jgi:two-component system LytT family response regulator